MSDTHLENKPTLALTSCTSASKNKLSKMLKIVNFEIAMRKKFQSIEPLINT